MRQLENMDPDRQPFFENIDLVYTAIFVVGLLPVSATRCFDRVPTKDTRLTVCIVARLLLFLIAGQACFRYSSNSGHRPPYMVGAPPCDRAGMRPVLTQ